MTIKDKNGTALEFGDTVRDERESNPKWSYYRFCYSGISRQSRRGCSGAGTPYGVFVNGSGRKSSFPAAPDGTIGHMKRVSAAASYAEVRTGDWVNDDTDEKPVVICSCCGSLIPIATEIGRLAAEDNRYCSFCGAKMEMMDNDG